MLLLIRDGQMNPITPNLASAFLNHMASKWYSEDWILLIYHVSDYAKSITRQHGLTARNGLVAVIGLTACFGANVCNNHNIIEQCFWGVIFIIVTSGKRRSKVWDCFDLLLLSKSCGHWSIKAPNMLQHNSKEGLNAT